MMSLRICALFAILVAANAQDCGQPPKMCPTSCCTGSFPGMLFAKNILTECGFPDYFPGEPPAGVKPTPPPCENFVCTMKKFNLVTPDNKMDKVALKAHMEKNYGSEWTPIIAKAIQTCGAAENPADPCPVGGFLHCLKFALVKDCPAPNWITSPDCVAMKAYVEKCPIPPPPPKA